MTARALYVASVCSLALAPLLVWQGRRVRRVTPRLPEASGPCDGARPGNPPEVRLLVLGESTAAGVGVRTHDDGLVGHIARALGAATGRAVSWRVRGRNGATGQSTRTDLLVQAGDFAPDVAVVVLGVNDTLRFCNPSRFVADLDALVEALRARQPGVAVAFTAVPPLDRFPALPWPLGRVLGLRARALDRAAADRWDGRGRVRHVPMPAGPRSVEALFCEDGFHPSAQGYAIWGRHVGETCAAMLDVVV